MGNKREHRTGAGWETGDYSRRMLLRLNIPYQLLMVCKLMEVAPQQLIIDFLDNLSCGSWKREGRDAAKNLLIEYFLEHGYGRRHYSAAEIRQVFRELDAIGLLFPRDGSAMIISEHSKWREMYHGWWFEKWHNKNNRIL